MLSSTSMSAHMTLGGDDAKKASTMGAIFLQGPHHVAPILITMSPVFTVNNFKKSVRVSKTLITCLDKTALDVEDEDEVDIILYTQYLK